MHVNEEDEQMEKKEDNKMDQAVTSPMDKETWASIDAYIGSFPDDVQEKLQAIRSLVRTIVPEASEKFSYGMPTFYYKGNLVHFAAYRGHIGFYPTPSGIASFAAELSAYKSAKGSVQFPVDQPLPLDLIGRIVTYRKAENEQQELLAKQVAREKAQMKAQARMRERQVNQENRS